MKKDPSRQEMAELVRLFTEERYPEAASLAKDMTARFPLHGLGWKVLGVVLKQLGRSEDALESLQKAAALMPSDADAHLNLAVAHQDMGRFQEAEAGFRNALRIKPRFAEANYCLGNTIRDLGRLEEAEAYYRQAIEIQPDFLDAHGNLGFVLQALGRLAEAEATYRRVLEVTPNCADTNYSLGNILRDLGRREEAAACYQRAIKFKPDFVEAHSNMGFILQTLGRSDEAEAIYRQTLQIAPDLAYAHFNLGKLLQDIGRLDEAKDSYRQALATKPDFTDAYNNLAVTLGKLKRADEALASYQRALQIQPDYVDAHCNMASLLNGLGRLDEALAHYRKALEVSPSLLTARMGINDTLSRTVPQWHVPMMNDQRRNDAYFAALKSAITPDSEVFEIGSGSGLVAMMTAKLGAKQVTTCEAVPLIAATARQIIADNGYDLAIKLISKRSTDVNVGQDLARQADILVSEIFSSELLGENVLPSIEDAKHRLLSPGGKVIPSAGSIMIALFGGDNLTRNVVVEDSFGFRLQRFNAIISEKQVIARNDLHAEMLSEDIEAFRFDFQNDSFFPSQTRHLRIPIKTPGRCYGIIQWIRLQMDEHISFENHPSEKSPVSNWQHCTYVFAEPIEVKPGQTVLVSASHNRIVPWFSLGGLDTP